MSPRTCDAKCNCYCPVSVAFIFLIFSRASTHARVTTQDVDLSRRSASSLISFSISSGKYKLCFDISLGITDIICALLDSRKLQSSTKPNVDLGAQLGSTDRTSTHPHMRLRSGRRRAHRRECFEFSQWKLGPVRRANFAPTQPCAADCTRRGRELVGLYESELRTSGSNPTR
jgi:hypothetical protein